MYVGQEQDRGFGIGIQMIKAIIYDKDGTLMQFDAFWVPIARAAIKQIVKDSTASGGAFSDGIVKEIERKIGIKGNTADACGILCGGTYSQFAAVITRVLRDSGATDKSIDRYAVEKALFAHIEDGKVLPPCDNLRKKLEDARKRARLFVVTTDNRTITEVCLEKLGIKDLFDEIYCDDGKIPHKPDPFAALDIAKKNGLKKKEIFMVGDTATDRDFADNAGINFVYVGSNADVSGTCAYNAGSVCDATDMILARGDSE